MATITHLTCEYQPNPLGIDVVKPRFSWRLQSARPGARQIAYRVLAASQPKLLKPGKADLWESDKVMSEQPVHLYFVVG